MMGSTVLRQKGMESANWRFLALFTVYMGVFVGLAQIPQDIYRQVSSFTAAAVSFFWKIFLIPVSSAATLVTIYDFRMEIILECTGLHYAAIYTAAVLAYQGHNYRYKAAGLLVGLTAIFLLNLLRLGIIGLVGHYSPDLFSFVHLYLWQGLFTLLVLLLWILWANGRLGISRLLKRQSLIAIVAASVSFALMFNYLDYYLSFLAYVADRVLPVLAGFMTVPGAVIAQGRQIGYVSGDEIIYSKTGLYTLNLVIFIALAAVAATASDAKTLLKRIALGAGLMIVCHLGLVFMDWSLELTRNDMLSSVIVWGITLSSMLAPLIAWACAALLIKRK